MPEIQNALELEQDVELQTGVCIVGGGAAGITLALQLQQAKIDVLLLESGGHDLDGPTQYLYQGENVGLDYFDLMSCRLRFFGGTTNHWAGYSIPPQPADFEARPDLGIAAWPVTYGEITPYVDRALETMGYDQAGFQSQAWLDKLEVPDTQRLEALDTALITKTFQIRHDYHFGRHYREALEQVANLKVLLNANVTHIGLSPGGGFVREVEARTLNGRKLRITARTVVLACHALENARLLLLSNDVHTAGIGNLHDNVGRYFSEHPKVYAGRFLPIEGQFPTAFFDRLVTKITHSFVSVVGLPPEFLQEHGILDYYCGFVRRFDEEDGGLALRKLKRSLSNLDFDKQDLEYVRNLLLDLGDAVEYVGERLDLGRREADYFELQHRIEQLPQRDSRVTLGPERDELGLNTIALDWRLSDVDYRTIRTGRDLVAKDLSRLGFGRFQLGDLDDATIDEEVYGAWHHYGTTRMGDDPLTSVVDGNGRVHGIDNLYIAGSSVFPRGGFSGPTLLIVAFAMRLAEHLQYSLSS